MPKMGKITFIPPAMTSVNVKTWKSNIQPMIQINPEEYKRSMDRSESLEQIIKGTRGGIEDALRYYIEWEKNVQRIIRERGGNV